MHGLNIPVSAPLMTIFHGTYSNGLLDLPLSLSNRLITDDEMDLGQDKLVNNLSLITEMKLWKKLDNGNSGTTLSLLITPVSLCSLT